MKTTVKNISLVLAGFLLIGSLTTATAQRTAFANEPGSSYVDPVAAIHQNIANLELEMETLRMVDKRSLTKSEKRAWKREKRMVRRRLSQQYDLLSRITTPMISYGYYGPYTPWRYNPYRTRSRVIINNSPAYCPPVNSQRPRRATTTTTTRTTTTRTAPTTRSNSVSGNSVNKSLKRTARKLK
jgi:anti-sigma28 factor (negative regulator of flagellin synthesis)